MNNKKYVIGLTGATGAIGKAFVRHLSQRSAVEVFALVRRQPAPTGSNMHFIPGDLLNNNVLEQLVTKSDVIVHLAACNSRTPEQDIKEMNVFFSTNGCATVALAKLAAHYAKRFVYSSTVAVYELSETDVTRGDSRRHRGCARGEADADHLRLVAVDPRGRGLLRAGT